MTLYDSNEHLLRGDSTHSYKAVSTSAHYGDFLLIKVIPREAESEARNKQMRRGKVNEAKMRECDDK